jgi:diguanylate cyclase (GGDEF)-like protein
VFDSLLNFPLTLLVGPEALALQSAWGGEGGAEGQIATAASVLEAVLVSQPAISLILIDAAPEIDHLQSAIGSLRSVNPGAHIVLLASPADEAACRRALAWGADQYEILPLDTRMLRQIQGVAPPHPPPTPTPSPTPFSTVAATLPDRLPDFSAEPLIPLALQAALLEEILEGAGLRPDFAQRATTALQHHLHLPGELFFDAGQPYPPASSSTPTFRQEVSFIGQAPCGTLVWQAGPAGVSTADPAALLTQAAHWLAAMLTLAQRFEQLRSLAATDELSGAFNRRYFIRFMTRLLQRAEEERFRVTLLLLDIDDFKKYNDQFGHASGDAIIRELVKVLRRCTRADDLVARLGGDEFAVVFWDSEKPRQPNSDHPKDVLAATERFRQAIRHHCWPETCKIQGTISISGGLATFPWHARTLDTLMARADEALLQAKAAGKNVIVMTPAVLEPAGVRVS